MNTEKFKQALAVLEDAKSQVAEILTGNEAASILLRVTAGLNSGITSLSHASGSANTAFATSSETQPITNFMGKKITKSPVAVSSEMVNPAEEDKKAFLKKVDDLYQVIETKDPLEVLKNFTIPEDQLALRGVAKRVGVPEYDTAALDVAFVEDIQLRKMQIVEENKALQDILNGKVDGEPGSGAEPDPIPAAEEETFQQRIDRINAAKSIDEINLIIAGEGRKTVLDAAEKMIAKL